MARTSKQHALPTRVVFMFKGTKAPKYSRLRIWSYRPTLRCDMGRNSFFRRTHFFSYPPPLGGVGPEKKISHPVSKTFFFPPPPLYI